MAVIQRFGGGLNLNVHFHTLVLDGVFTEGEGGTLYLRPDKVHNIARRDSITVALRLHNPSGGDMAGTWTTITNAPPDDVATMLLLTDGTVLAQGYGTNAWYKLSPNAQRRLRERHLDHAGQQHRSAALLRVGHAARRAGDLLGR